MIQMSSCYIKQVKQSMVFFPKSKKREDWQMFSAFILCFYESYAVQRFFWNVMCSFIFHLVGCLTRNIYRALCFSLAASKLVTSLSFLTLYSGSIPFLSMQSFFCCFFSFPLYLNICFFVILNSFYFIFIYFNKKDFFQRMYFYFSSCFIFFVC